MVVGWAPSRPPGAVLRLPAGIAGLFFFRESAIINSLRTAGETGKVDRALKNSNSSCLSMTLRQELLHTTHTSLWTGWQVPQVRSKSATTLAVLTESTNQQPSNWFSHGSLNLYQPLPNTEYCESRGSGEGTNMLGRGRSCCRREPIRRQGREEVLLRCWDQGEPMGGGRGEDQVKWSKDEGRG
jgi:hypothetical protein